MSELENKLRHIEIDLDANERESNELLSQLDLTQEEIGRYLENPEHFQPEEWQFIQDQKQELEEKLSKALSQVKAPADVAKSRASQRFIQRDWLFVR